MCYTTIPDLIQNTIFTVLFAKLNKLQKYNYYYAKTIEINRD